MAALSTNLDRDQRKRHGGHKSSSIGDTGGGGEDGAQRVSMGERGTCREKEGKKITFHVRCVLVDANCFPF